MKVQIPKTYLNLATTRVQGAISERNLAQIGLMAKNSRLYVSANDRALSIYSNFVCETLQDGVVFVPARLFSDVVKELHDGPVRLETDEANLVITSGKHDDFVMKLPIAFDAVWREPPPVEGDSVANLPCTKLSYMIDQIQYCIAQESPRNYATVAYLHKIAPDALRLVGTDGFRLAYSDLEMTLPALFLEPSGVCLSKRVLAEIQRMTAEGFESVRVSLSADQTTLSASVGDYEIFARLSAVKYPGYASVLPSGTMTPVKVSRPYLQSVARRVLLAADKTRALQLLISESSLTLSARTVGSSEGKETVPLEGYKGPSRQLAVNGKYLTDVFSATTADSLTMQFKSDEEPIVIKPDQEPDGCRSLHVLVPIKESEA